MKRLFLLFTVVAMFSFFISTGVRTFAEETEKPEYTDEFLERVEKRLKYFQKAIKRFEKNKGKSGDALAQAARDHLRPADHPDIVNVILQTLNKIKDGQVISALVKALSTVKPGPCLNFLIAKGMRKGKPTTRALVIEGLAKGEVTEIFTLICELLKDTKEPELVRAACARGLGFLNDARGVNVLVSVEKDKSELVKMSVIEGCMMFKDDVSGQCIAALINDDSSKKVRAAAIHASVARNLAPAVGYLILRLRKEEGRLFGDVLKALRKISGTDRGENIIAWEEWFEHSEFAKKGKIKKIPRKDVPGNYTTITYHGIRTHSKNVVFIIDRSESMKEKCDPKALKGDYMKPDEKFRGDTRMKLVKWALTNTLKNLDKNTSFNIIAYSTDIRTWKKKSFFATDSNKKTAIRWVNALSPEGRTNTWGALLAAFGCKSFGDGRFNANPMGDTIFLLTDGDPNEGELDDPDEILAGVKELNRTQKIVIHCIAVGRFNKAFCQRLAEENDGEFKDLGD